VKPSSVALMFAVCTVGLVSSAIVRAQQRTIVVTAQDVRVSGARVAFTSDGGCTIQPECTTALPEVKCDGSPQTYNRAGSCAAARQAAMRAATIDVGVSDGGVP